MIVDALLGIGLDGAPREDAARMIGLINAAAARSSRSTCRPASTRRRARSRARRCARPRPCRSARRRSASRSRRARLHAGRCTVAPLGLRPREHEHALVPASVLLEVPRKQTESTKYSAGSVLVVGGSRGLTGAPMLASLAAFRADAGYVAIAAPESTLPVLETRLLEASSIRCRRTRRAGCSRARRTASSQRPRRPTRWRSAPGWAGPTARSSWCASCSSASTCRSCSTRTRSGSSSRSRAPRRRSLTPHAGELARLLGTTSAEIGAHRLDAVRRAASRFGSVVLLEGPRHARRGAARRRAGRELRNAGARDRRDRRRAHRHRRPRFSQRASSRSWQPRLRPSPTASPPSCSSPQGGAVASDLLPGLRLALAGHGLQRAPLAAG